MPIASNLDNGRTHWLSLLSFSEHFGFVMGKLDITGGDKNEFA